MGYSDGALRALTLTDVINQINQDSGTEIPFDPNEVINQVASDTETLKVGSESLTTTTLTNYPLNVIQDVGPVAYWRLDDPLSSTTVYDSNPWASTTYPKVPGTVNGTVTFQVTGAMNGSKAATFNGTSGYVEVPNGTSLQVTGDLTIECWLKTASLAATQTILSKGTTGEYHLVLNTNGSVTLQMGPTYSQVVVPAASIGTGTWYHLVVTRTLATKTVRAYLNGSNTFGGSYTTTPSTTTNVVRLGATSPTAGGFFNGQLDEVALYARALSGTQVANHHTWGLAADVGSTGWKTGRYGYIQYPTPGQASGSLWGTVTWGGSTWS